MGAAHGRCRAQQRPLHRSLSPSRLQSICAGRWASTTSIPGARCSMARMSVGCAGVCVLGCVAATVCVRSLVVFAFAREALTVCSDGRHARHPRQLCCWSACSCVRYRAPLCVQTRVRAVARGAPRGRRMDHVGEGRRSQSRRHAVCRREAEALDRQRRRAREGAARTGRHWAAGRIEHREASGRGGLVERTRGSHGRPRPAEG